MATSAGATLASGYWDTQTGSPATAPGAGKYRADNWAAPTLVAVAGIDANGYDRQAGLVALQPGDLISQLGTASDSQNYQRWTVASVTDQGTWAALAVSVAENGSSFTPPGSNQRRLLQALSVTDAAPPPLQPWMAWAPPLDPPTTGGLDADTAQHIADATWADDPHLCAALQWEFYAATLAPGVAVAQVSTGAQSVSYQPPMPAGDAGAAMARAAWHRSFTNGGSIPLDLAPPAVQTVPGDQWSGLVPDWWAVA